MKKLVIGLVPMLVIVAFAVMPVAAQATQPCYTKNSTLCSSVKSESTPTEVTAQGTVTLKTVVGGSGEVTCDTVAAGTIWNPVEGKGEGRTELFAAYNCADTACPFYTEVVQGTEAWPSVLIEEVPGIIRQRTSGVKLNVLCWESYEASVTPGDLPLGGANFVGSLEPQVVNKPNTVTQPTLLEFEPPGSSGKLEAEGSGGTVLAEVEGNLALLGTNLSEVIHAVPGP